MGETTELLRRWRDGDEGALAELMRQSLPLIRRAARAKLGAELRAKVTTDDVVQEAVLDFLRNGPRDLPVDSNQLHALLVRIVVNTVRDQGQWFRAARRHLARERNLASSQLPIDEHGATDPVDTAARGELATRLRLALELLDERDRRLIVWREWQKRAFADIGSELQIGEEGARSAFRRALLHLRETMARLRRGELEAVLGELDRRDRLEH